MKKMKMFLLAAMLIGIGSAFTTASVQADQLWVLASDGETYITEEDAISRNGVCNSSFTNETCTYLDDQGTPNPFSNIGRYVYP